MQLRSARQFLVLGVLLGATARCSFFAPPDSETVGTRPTNAGGSSGMGAAGSNNAGEAGSNDGDPVDVGTPTGTWAIPTGALLTSFASDVKPSNVHREYPRPQLVRSAWATLNGLWDYALRNKVDAEPSAWDGKILVPFPVESALSGVSSPLTAQGQLWYRRTFELPAAWRGQRLLLHFGAADFDTNVFVNGKAIGEHVGGYDAFTFDVTDALVTDQTQEVVVSVNDPTDSGGQPRGKQSLSSKLGSVSEVSGIWQSVWLEPVPTAYIDSLALVPNAGAGKVAVTATLAGAPSSAATIAVTITDGGTTVASANGPAASTLTLAIPHAKPWSPASPTLYDVTVSLLDDSGTVDSVQSYVGLRDVAVQADDAGVSRVFLNENPLFQLGVIDQGMWPDGLYTAPTDEAMQTDISRAKQLGFVALRKHQKIEPDRFYYWCDKLGLLVWQDMPAAGNTSKDDQAEFQTELSALVTQHANHPSIVAWDLFYFGGGQFDPSGLTDAVRALDPTRLVDTVTGYPDDGSGDVRDRPDFARASSPTPTKRAAVLGAFGSMSQGVDGHVWHPSGSFGYDATKAVPLATDSYETLIDNAFGLNAAPGLSVAMFRQLTDVEGELDGLFTYDRAILKVDSDRVTQLNAGKGEPIYTVLETSDMAADPAFTPSGASSYAAEPHVYRYTLVDPGAGWEQPGFDDSTWSEGPAGFGSGEANAVMSTRWVSGEIWVRGTFDYEGPLTGSAYARVFYDNDVWMYVNGNPAVSLSGFDTTYQDFIVSDAAQRSLMSGKGLVAARCINTSGPEFLDLGLVLRADGPTLLAATNPVATAPGAIYTRYDTTDTTVPAFSTLTPVDGGVSTVLNLDAAAGATDDYSLEFEGFIEAPADGVYTFFIASDDNSVLAIDGQQVLAVNRHPDEYSANIGLKAGKHAFTLGYAQVTGAATLNVSWAGPGLPKQAIAAAAISHAVQPAVTVAGAQPAAAVAQYNGTYSAVPDFDTLTPNATTTAATISTSVANVSNFYALDFTGYIDVPTAGVYTFLLTADDGAIFSIGDAVIDNDGQHAASTVSGQVALAVGKHAFKLGYLQFNGPEVLDLSWIGPSLAQEAIPASALFH